MPKVGVRELKNNATRIVRAVREEHAEYVVTVNGEPVAVLRPYTAADETAESLAAVDEYLARLDELGAEVTKAWRTQQTAAEAITEQRR
jgi:prevent-host-death family protein